MTMPFSRRSLLVTPFAAPFARAEPKISVLVIDGINNHDWQAGTRAIREILEGAGRFRVDVSTTPPREAPVSAWDSWRPAFRRYNVVISNFNGGHLADGIRWPQRVEENFETYLRGGGGF